MQAAEFEYDIVGHPQSDFHFSVTFPFHKLKANDIGKHFVFDSVSLLSFLPLVNLLP